MRNHLVFLVALLCQTACGNNPRQSPQTARAESIESGRDVSGAKSPGKKSSETKGWSEVQPLESSTSPGTNNRKSRITVSSDPAKHGDSLHFRFLVNNVPISGVFVAPGGQSTTFTIPIGTVHFTVDECEWEAQGFELGPDEEMPISCKLAKDGDCCEVAIPVEDKSSAK